MCFKCNSPCHLKRHCPQLKAHNSEKLGCSYQNEATIGGSNDNSLPTLTINYAGNPNSAIIRINNQKFRTVIDSGADTCLMNSKVYNSLKGVPKLSKKKACLQTVDGDPIKVHGSVSIKIQIGTEILEHLFHVLPQMKNNIIFVDWLIKFGVREYWGMQCIKVGKSYIPLVEDIHINSVLCLASQVILKPQSVSCVMAKRKIADKISLRKIFVKYMEQIRQASARNKDS